MNDSITDPRGFSAGGVSCGLKKDHQPDLALITSDPPAAAAAVFTRNIVKGHSLKLSMRHIQGGVARAFLINSGNANACVGPQGDEDAANITAACAGLLNCPQEQILFNSTGVIGIALPADRILEGLPPLVAGLRDDADGGHAAELAIMTTDLQRKEATERLTVDGREITISGMAKGSGMIHPDMATMIGVITTDCAILPDTLDGMLHRAVTHTFNRVSVDGDTSVCDMVAFLANGAAGNAPLNSEHEAFEQALFRVCERLARLIAADGEGATKLIEIIAEGVRSAPDAKLLVQTIARSPLVKTAIFGQDANWGRIITAAGYSGAQFDPDRCDIDIGDLAVCRSGHAVPFDEEAASRILAQDEVAIRLNMNEGKAWDRMWTCDFSYDYVRINGSYRS